MGDKQANVDEVKRPSLSMHPMRGPSGKRQGDMRDETHGLDAGSNEWFMTHFSQPTDKEFALFQVWIEREAGIHLSSTKKPLLAARLAGRLSRLGLRSFEEYFRYLREHEDTERTVLLDQICTNETHFFRESHQFDYLEREVYPRWMAEAAAGTRARHLTVWSAGCSSGEEPYSLAMSLLHHFPASAGWRIDVVGTDISGKMLLRAQEAVWPVEKAAEIPEKYLKSFMLKGVRTQAGRMRATAELRAVVRIGSANLNAPVYSVGGPFDLVFCRNVLIYFAPETKERVVNRLLENLVEGGLLFLGHAETLQGMDRRGAAVGPAVYARGTRR